MDRKIIWRTINAGFLFCIGLFGAGGFLGIASPGFLHIFIAFAVLLLLTVWRGMLLRGRGLFPAGVLTVLLGLGAAAGGERVRLFLWSYWYWLTDRPLWQQEWLPGYELVQTVLFALLCYGIQMVMERDFRFRLAEILAVFSMLLYFLFTEKELSRTGVVFMLCYAILLYAEWTQSQWKKEKRKSVQAYMLWLMPFFTVYFGLMFLPKMPKEPYDWHIVKSIYGQFRESFLKFSFNYLRGDDEDYDLSLGGFSESGRLEGENEGNRRELMVVKNESARTFHLYLSGMVYDTFDGRQWEQRNSDTSKERYIDAAETLAAVERYDKEYRTDYLARLDIRINYRYFRSGFLFAPLKTTEMKQGIGELDFNELGGSLYFDGKNGYGTEYEVSFYQLNAGQDAFWQFLTEAAVLEEDTAAVSEEEDTEGIQRYRQEIYDHYLGDVTLSDEVETYLGKITAGAGTDVEKLKAIEAELSSFTYTRTPGELPERVGSGGEFLDYFLLESREGYCTYFATAFVLLARAEGLPARYVQGFCVPVSNQAETLVYADMAHAWPEVYFEGVGWIPFEPTPGYAQLRYTSWGMRKEREAGEATGAADWQAAQEREMAAVLEEPEEWQESLAALTEESGWKRFLQVSGAIGLWALLAVLLICLLNRLSVRIRYRKMDLTARFRVEADRNRKLLAFMGLKREQEETLTEFKNRAEAVLGRENALQFLQSYEDFIYGDKEIEQRILEETKRQQEELGEALKRKRRWAYFVYRVMY